MMLSGSRSISNIRPLLALTIAAMLSFSTSHASVIFSDDFNEGGFIDNPDLLNSNSDRWAHTDYYHALDNNGWTFTGRMLYAINSDNGDGALTLQEPFAGIGSAAGSRTVTGLTAGQKYYVSFLMSGDNIPGQAYELGMSVDGANLLTLDGVDGNPGSNSGTTETASFRATSSSAVLSFSENSHTLASPVIDNLLISDTPPPPPKVAKLRGVFSDTSTGFLEKFLVSTNPSMNISGFYYFDTFNDSLGGNTLAAGNISTDLILLATGGIGTPSVLIHYDVFNGQISPTNVKLQPGTYVGLVNGSTLTFTAVPEPGGWIMMLVGATFAGSDLRRRRKPITTRGS